MFGSVLVSVLLGNMQISGEVVGEELGLVVIVGESVGVEVSFVNWVVVTSVPRVCEDPTGSPTGRHWGSLKSSITVVRDPLYTVTTPLTVTSSSYGRGFAGEGSVLNAPENVAIHLARSKC